MYEVHSYYWNKSPYVNYKDDFPEDSDLFVVCVGFSKLKTLPYFDTIHNSRKDYQLIYVNNGNMHFIACDGTEQIAPKGSFLLFKPGERQQYTMYLKDNTEFYWIHFAGKQVEPLLRHFDLFENRFYNFRPNPEIPIIYNNIIDCLEQRAPYFCELCAVYLQELILKAIKFNIKMSIKEDIPPILEKITNYIEEHFNDKISIEKIANDNNLSSRMLQRYFKKYYSVTPQQYITDIRITKAKKLLCSTNSIEKIAQAVGFSDAMYFSTVFHKVTGQTPTEYKKSIQNRYIKM